MNEKQKSNGLEGVTKEGNYLIVTFQREWVNDPVGRVHLGLYNLVTQSWKFVCYFLDSPESQFGEQSASDVRSKLGVACGLYLADVIIDLVETGSTMKSSSLAILVFNQFNSVCFSFVALY